MRSGDVSLPTSADSSHTGRESKPYQEKSNQPHSQMTFESDIENHNIQMLGEIPTLSMTIIKLTRSQQPLYDQLALQMASK